MAQRIAILALILALGGSALGVSPAHAGERDPGMASCCKAARAHDVTPAVQAARLCCAVNCPEPAPTSSVFSLQLSQLAPLLHAAHVKPPAVVPGSLSYLERSQVRSPNSEPTYIRNLALLI